MANVLNGNTFFADTTSSAATVGSYVNNKDILIESYIISGAANSTVTISDLRLENSAYTAGDTKLVLNIGANATNPFFLDGTPIKCPNGIWVTIDSGSPKLTLVLKYKG